MNHTFCKNPFKLGDNIIHETTVPTSNMMAYMILVEVEFRHEGHAAQHNEQAALPQHHASYKNTFKEFRIWLMLKTKVYMKFT